VPQPLRRHAWLGVLRATPAEEELGRHMPMQSRPCLAAAQQQRLCWHHRSIAMPTQRGTGGKGPCVSNCPRPPPAA
jgi:hypothetical protein